MTGETRIPDTDQDRGVVFAATGPDRYIQLARRAAASVKQSNPGIPVDLYTDKPCEDPTFDQVHILQKPWHRSKIEALATSRFTRTLMLDCDLVVLADLGDVFEVLERFDVALAHDQAPNYELCHTFWRKRLPAAFAQFNSGVMAVRKSSETLAMLETWEASVKLHGIGRDQPALREVLWDSNLRIATLPEEYNLMAIDRLKIYDRYRQAPRIIHSPAFNAQFNRYARAEDPVIERLGLRTGSRLKDMLAEDLELAFRAGRQPQDPAERDRIGRWLWIAQRLPARLWGGVYRRFVARRY